MVFDDRVSATVGQPIQLGITSQVGVLEIHGTVRGTREAAGPFIALPERPALGLAVEFSRFGTTEELILASLLEELREGPASVTVTALLTPQETGDLLLEVCSTDTEATKLEPLHPAFSPSGPESSPTSERRLAVRVNLSIPVEIEGVDVSPQSSKQATVTSNISLGGVCLHFMTTTNPVGRRFLLHLTSPPQGSDRATHSAPSEPQPIAVIGEVIWTAPGSTSLPDLTESPASAPLQVGVRFLDQSNEDERRIAELAGRHLISPAAVEDGTESGTLKSELLECRNSRGQRIAVYHDQPRNALPPGSPLAIISPGYGETKKEYVTLAYYLASNGFHVLRYDHTNHVGESEGDIRDSTLSGMKQDLVAILDYATLTWPDSPVVVAATSLAGRVALKAASQDHRISLVILLAGVVDVQATLLAVHQEDLIGTYLRGTRRGVINMLGFNIHADEWLEDASKEGYGNLHTSIGDAERIRTPVVFFSAEHDAWVSFDSVKAVQAALQPAQRKLYLIPEGLHRLHENPRKARAVFRQLVSCCLSQFYPLSPQENLREPSQREVGLQNRVERERARAQHHMAKAENVEFWQDYLDHFHYIANVTDFWQLLDHIYRLADAFEKEGHILDAGCGNGNFGMFLLINQAYRQRNAARSDSHAMRYIGIDFVRTALVQARLNLANAADELRKKQVSAHMMQSSMISSVSLADLNMPLPFRDNQFDRIVSNLVIGYLRDPMFTLRELLRVLAPNGKLVLTNLKPHADLSKRVKSHFCHRPIRVSHGAVSATR
jgi:alpha-beta hydrolase superfamily lysophospholipase/SAM-dependent methyltransferase